MMMLKNAHNQIQNELALQMDCENLILLVLHACPLGQSELKHIFFLVDMHAKLIILDFHNPFVMQVHFLFDCVCFLESWFQITLRNPSSAG